MNRLKEWWSENWVIVVSVLFFTVFFGVLISLCFYGIKIELEKENIYLQGEQQLGVIIINENQYRLDGPDAFKAATKEIQLEKYEHIIVDGVDYFILKR
jgi:hypothetical protein